MFRKHSGIRGSYLDDCGWATITEAILVTIVERT